VISLKYNLTMTETELIVRAVAVEDGKILLCKNLIKGHYFLPGGHIEHNELPEIALERELIEEIGRKIKKVKQVAEIKNSYECNGETINEVFYVYLVILDDYVNIKSKEDHLEFDWVLIDELKKINFKPKKAIKDILKNIEANKDYLKSDSSNKIKY